VDLELGPWGRFAVVVAIVVLLLWLVLRSGTPPREAISDTYEESPPHDHLPGADD
jgi:hypothetical protein